MTGAGQMTSSNQPDRIDLLLQASRRSLFVLLALILLISATIIAHVLRPGSLLADWSARAPWLLPVAIVAIFGIVVAPMRRLGDAEMKTLRDDEFRQANLGRAQRVALIAALVAQIPLAVLASGLTAAAAVTIMGVATVTVATATLITSFLYFERD
ncbi:MAG TPA: hypothetical protein VKU62_13560 [Thermoanaerobaculia bacterium]|nr:hypothetical protein [Thermoanaerobaculia bacterium]